LEGQVKSKMQVDLGGEKYKVFLDIYELSIHLKNKDFPKERRSKIPQKEYFMTVINAIDGIEFLTKKIDINKKFLE